MTEKKNIRFVAVFSKCFSGEMPFAPMLGFEVCY